MADEISALKEYFNRANRLDFLATCFHLCISEGFVLLKVKHNKISHKPFSEIINTVFPSLFSLLFSVHLLLLILQWNSFACCMR